MINFEKGLAPEDKNPISAESSIENQITPEQKEVVYEIVRDVMHGNDAQALNKKSSLGLSEEIFQAALESEMYSTINNIDPNESPIKGDTIDDVLRVADIFGLSRGFVDEITLKHEERKKL